MQDPFIGTWQLNPGKSTFDANHQPTAATLRWQRDEDGAYLMLGEGINAKGELASERPQKLVPDGQPYPVPDFPGLSCVTTRPSANTLRAQVMREDGSVAGDGSYTVEGTSMTAVTSGFDTQLRRFEMRTVWEKKE